MEIKTFQADTLQDALDRVRRELGPNAIVLHTRHVEQRSCFGWRRRTVVEIRALSAADSPAPEKQPLLQRLDRREALIGLVTSSPYEGVMPAMSPSRPSVSFSELSDSPRPAQSHGPPRLREQIVQQDFPRTLFPCEFPEAGVSKPLNAANPTLLELELERKLRSEIHFGGPVEWTSGRRRIVALVGPTGCGKTTTTAKLAAHYAIRERCKVGLLSLDTFRIGAAEQLRSFADVLEIPIEVVSDADRMQPALNRLGDRELLFFDTPGTSPNNRIKLQTITAALDAARVDEVHLLLPACAATPSLRQVLEQFQTLNYTDLILSKWDEGCGLGNFLPILRGNIQPLRYITTGQNVPHDLEPATPRRLAR